MAFGPEADDAGEVGVVDYYDVAPHFLDAGFGGYRADLAQFVDHAYVVHYLQRLRISDPLQRTPLHLLLPLPLLWIIHPRNLPIILHLHHFRIPVEYVTVFVLFPSVFCLA